MDYTSIIEQLFTQLDLLTNAYVFKGYTALAHALAAPLFSAGIIAISLFGLGISMGWIKGSFNNLIKLVIKLGLVYGFAMNWGIFSEYVYGVMTQAGGDLGQVLIQNTPLPIPHLSGSGIDGALQFSLNEFIQLGQAAWSQGKIGLTSHIQPFFGAIIIWLSGMGMVLAGLFELALAKIMTAVLLAVAPLFIGFIIFKPTQTFFDRWLGALVGYALLPLFVSAMLGLSLSISQWALASAFAQHIFGVDGINIYVISAIVGLLGIFVILRAGSLAQSIGGTVSTSGAGGFIAGMATGAAGMGMGLLSKGKGLLNLPKTIKNLGASLVSGFNQTGSQAANGAASVYKNIRRRLQGGTS